MSNASPTQAPRFLVLGSFVQACCWRVARLPRAGESLQATGVHIELGGKGLNVGIGIARLAGRATVNMVLGVGRDAPAQQLRRLLLEEGIGIEHVYSLADQSGYGSGHIGGDGQNAIAVFAGPNLLLTAHHAELAQASIAAADVVYAQFETSQALIVRAFELAKQSVRAPLTVLNPSPWQDLTPELLQWVDVLLVNATEAGELLALSHSLQDQRDLTLAAAASQMASAVSALWQRWPAATPRHLIVTLGALGCVSFSCDGTYVQMPGFAVNAVDTVGCGDAFASALCVGLARGKPLAHALREAHACGAMVASQAGVLTALPTSDEVRHFLGG